MRMLVSGAVLALTILSFPSPAAAQPDPLRERFVERLDSTGGGAGPAAYRRMWEVMDSLVLRELGRGRSADEVNRALAELPGYSDASEGRGFSTGRATFYSELPRELPGYVVLPIRAGREALLMGVYNFGVASPGRVSVFARRGGAWRRTGVADSRFTVVPYLLPLADSGLAVVTLETFTGASYQSGTARAWRVRRGVLEPLRTVATEMLEPHAETTNRTVRISFTRRPGNLGAANLGTRRGFAITISPAGQTVTVRTEVITPWVEVVDQYYGLARQAPARARALLASPSLATRLGSREPMSHNDGGDLRAGTGWLVLGIGERSYRVSSRRGSDGQWRITAVEPQ